MNSPHNALQQLKLMLNQRVPLNKEIITPQLYGGILPDNLLFDLSFVLGEVVNSQRCSSFRPDPYYVIVWNTVLIPRSLVSNVGRFHV